MKRWTRDENGRRRRTAYGWALRVLAFGVLGLAALVVLGALVTIVVLAIAGEPGPQAVAGMLGGLGLVLAATWAYEEVS